MAYLDGFQAMVDAAARLIADCRQAELDPQRAAQAEADRRRIETIERKLASMGHELNEMAGRAQAITGGVRALGENQSALTRKQADAGDRLRLLMDLVDATTSRSEFRLSVISDAVEKVRRHQLESRAREPMQDATLGALESAQRVTAHQVADFGERVAALAQAVGCLRAEVTEILTHMSTLEKNQQARLADVDRHLARIGSVTWQGVALGVLLAIAVIAVIAVALIGAASLWPRTP